MFDSPPRARHRKLSDQSILFAMQPEHQTSRVDRQLDSIVGQTAHDSRWKMMKKKYSIAREKVKRLPLDPKVFMRVHERQKQRMAKTELSEKVRSPTKCQNPESTIDTFFQLQKSSLKFFEQTSPFYEKLKLQRIAERKTQRNNSWYNCFNNSNTIRKNRKITKAGTSLDMRQRIEKREKSFQHPALKLYSTTTNSVIKSCRLKTEIKKPFDWFVSPFDLEDL